MVNNVETLVAAARILGRGPSHFRASGTSDSPGTKLLSVAGDCLRPGIYEIEWGLELGQLLEKCGAVAPSIIQVGGPSGELCTPADFRRRFSMSDLRCGGSVMVFNAGRDLMEILLNYNQFFINESCGICTPCRAGNFILGKRLASIDRGQWGEEDFDRILEWCRIIAAGSRCGLGKTAPASIVQALEKAPDGFVSPIPHSSKPPSSFQLSKAIEAYDTAVQKTRRK